MTDSAYDVVGHVNVTVTAASANGAVANIGTADAGRVRVLLIAEAALFWNSGKTSVTATSADRFMAAGTQIEVVLPHGHDNIGAIRKTADGSLGIYTIG